MKASSSSHPANRSQHLKELKVGKPRNIRTFLLVVTFLFKWRREKVRRGPNSTFPNLSRSEGGDIQGIRWILTHGRDLHSKLMKMEAINEDVVTFLRKALAIWRRLHANIHRRRGLKEMRLRQKLDCSIHKMEDLEKLIEVVRAKQSA